MEKKSMNEPSRSEADLKEDILKTGNAESYEALSVAYLDHAPGDFLSWALIMANKYDYPQAHFDVFHQVTQINDESMSLENLDTATQQLALKHLEKAHKLGHEQASEIFAQLLIDGKYLPKNEDLGQSILSALKKK